MFIRQVTVERAIPGVWHVVAELRGGERHCMATSATLSEAVNEVLKRGGCWRELDYYRAAVAVLAEDRGATAPDVLERMALKGSFATMRQARTALSAAKVIRRAEAA